jgi:hypothetical protein
MPVVVYTRRLGDFWRKRYWVECWDCALKVGPLDSRDDAGLYIRSLRAIP